MTATTESADYRILTVERQLTAVIPASVRMDKMPEISAHCASSSPRSSRRWARGQSAPLSLSGARPWTACSTWSRA